MPILNEFKVTFLGTGTSQGVPVIGCSCAVCRSGDPRDNRLRVSILLQINGKNYVVDAGPDFRQQMLRTGISELEAVLVTHEHNDHIIGFDDVRPFNFRQRRDMDVFATGRVQAELRQRFEYVFAAEKYPGAPSLRLWTIDKDTPFQLDGIPVQPIEVLHARLPVLGFRIGDFAYVTDAKTIAPQELEKLKNLDVLVLNALHHTPHYSHLNLAEALALVAVLKPKKAYFTHVSHAMGLTSEVESILPENVALAHDQLTINLLG